MALKVGELFALFTIDSSGVTRGMNNISTKLSNMSKEFTQAGLLWTSAITRPIVDAGKDAVDKSMQFSKEMAKTYAKTGIDINTEEGQAAMEALEETAQTVAKDSVFTMVEVAGAYDKMAMAGWDYRSMLGGLEPIMDLAAASGEDVVTVSDIVTDAMTAFGLTFEAAGKDVDTFQGMVNNFTDVLAAAATSSNTDVAKMGESFKYVGSMAGMMGYNIEDVAVALGLMANRGTKASQAGTSLRRLFQVLSNPNNQQAAIMDELGLSLTDDNGKALTFMELMESIREKFAGLNIDTEEYAAQVDALSEEYLTATDAAAEFEKMGGVIDEAGNWTATTKEQKSFKSAHAQDIKDYKAYIAALESLNEQFIDSQQNGAELTKVAKASGLLGARGMLSILSIVGASEEEWNNLIESIYGSEGRTHSMKETMLDNAQGKLEMFQSSVDVLKTQIGDLINQSLTPMISKATELINKFINMDDETKESILKLVGVAAAIGPVLVGVGLLAKLLPSLTSAFSFLASPIGIVTALLAALAISALDTNGTISQALGGIGDMLGLDLSNFSLSDINIDGMLDGLFGGIADLSTNPAITGFMEKIGEGLANALGSLGDICGKIIAYILSPEGLSKIWEAGKSIGNLLLQAIQGVLGGIVSFFGNLINSALVSWGLLDKEKLEAHEENLKTGEDFRKKLAEDFAKGFEDENITSERVNDSLIEALFLQYFGGDYDQATFNKVAGQMKDKIAAAMGEAFAGTDLSDSVAGMYLEEMISNLWDDMMLKAKEAREDETIDFTGADVKSMLGGFLESLGIASDYFSDEIYDQIAAQILSGDLTSENSLLSAIFSKLFQSEEPEVAAAEATEDAKDAAINEARSMVEETAEELGTPNTMEEAGKQASEAGVSGMETALVDGKDKVGVAAAQVSNEAVQQFLLVMSEKNGKTIGSSYIGGVIAGIRNSGILATFGAIGQSINYIISSWLSVDKGYSIGYAYGEAIGNGMTMAMEAKGMTYMPQPTVRGTGNTVGENGANNQTVTADMIAKAVKAALNGIGLFMDADQVGDLVTDRVSQNIALETANRGGE